MADLQKIYDGCKKNYDNCFRMIQIMSSGIKTFMYSKGVTDYHPETTLMKFDILLQYSLLQIATADYEMDRNELIFIRDLTKAADIVDYLNSFGGAQITWDMIYRADIFEIRKLLDLLRDEIVRLSKEFVMVFSTCDLVTPQHDYLSDLTENILCIIVGLTSMDGKVESSETNADCLILHALDEIKKIKCR